MSVNRKVLQFMGRGTERERLRNVSSMITVG